MIHVEKVHAESKADRITRLTGLANRIDWLLAFVFLGWAAYQSSLMWAVVGGSFLATAWINPVARARKAMARKLVKRTR